MKKGMKLIMKKRTKVVLSAILIFALVLSAGLFLSKGNIINKIFADKAPKKSITEKIIEDYEVNDDDVAFNGLEISFVDRADETGSPVDYGILKSDGTSSKDIWVKIYNKFPTEAHITRTGGSGDGLDTSFDGSSSFDLPANTAISVKINYNATGSVSEGGVYAFITNLSYTLDDVYDGDSSSLKTFNKSFAFAASYKATPTNNYNTITMLNWAVRDGASDINFTMTPNLINSDNNFYANTSFDQGSCTVAKSSGLANSQPSKCSASYTINMFVNRQVYDEFSDVGFSFDIKNSANDSGESLKFDGTPSLSWNDNDTVPTITSELAGDGISSKNGTGTLAFNGSIPAHDTVSPKVLSIPIDFIENVGGIYAKTKAALSMTVNLYAYTTTSYNNLLNLVTTQEQSGLIDELASNKVDLSDYYAALRDARKALANPRKTDYEMDNAYNTLNSLYNGLIDSNNTYNANKFMTINDLFFSGDMSSGTATESKTHYRVYVTDDSYTIPQDSTYLNAGTTNKHSVQYTGTADNNYVFNNKYWHINSPADTSDISNAIAEAEPILAEDTRKYTSDSRQALADAVEAATSYAITNAIDEPECDSDFTDIVTEIEDAIDGMTIATYTIQYLDDDEETVIQTATLAYGTAMPSAPADPSKTSTAQYEYAFDGWVDNATGANSTVVEDVTYIATYTESIRSYTIVFEDEDKTELQSGLVEYGQTPTPPADPTKAADVQYTYTFAGWDPEVAEVTGDITYTATYTGTLNKYTITFKDYNGNILKQNEVDYGEMPTPPEDPTRAMTTETVYTFIGWDSEISSVTGAKIYTANYSESPRPYTITFVDEDGQTVLYSNDFGYGETPTYGGEEPTKDSDAQYTYEFDAWSPAITTVTGEATYQATYTATIRSYQITFKNYDGTKLSSEMLDYGEMPTAPADPEKPADAQYTYTFTGWSPSVDTVTGDQTYEPTYSTTTNTYTIIFYDTDGTTQLDKQVLEYGVTPVYAGETPTMESTAAYDYVFAGWDKEILSVTGDTEYVAQYTPVKRSYDITFDPNNGEEATTIQVEYGQTPSYGEDPTKAADAQYTYTFTGWSPQIEAVSGPATYTAQYSSVINSYTIIFNDEDGTELDSQVLEYGQTPTPPADPTKESTDQYSFEFAGWSPSITTVTGAQTYTATYTETTRKYTITFTDYDDSVLKSEELVYGATPTAPTDPTRESTTTEIYTFTGWNNEIVAVTGEATYKATYSTATRYYTITFVDSDGETELQSSQLEYGATPTPPADPTKESTVAYDYTFAGWDKEILPVSGDTTYTAQYTPSKRKYMITFNLANGGGSVGIESEYGEMPTTPENPTKESTAEYTYEFSGWSPELVEVTGETTYTAQYTETKRKYMITFNLANGGGTVGSEVEYGTVPTPPEDPVKEADAEYTYTFTGWSPEVVAVTGEATYTAQFSQTKRKYTITFVNYDNTELQSSEVEYGETPVYSGETPTKPSTSEHSYEFTGWSPEISSVTGAKTYTATFTETARKYTITFVDEDETVLKTSELEYGETPVAPENPTKEPTAEFTYTFSGWDQEILPVTGDTTYTAHYTPTKRKYMITFNLANGGEIVGSEVEYGTVPTPPEDPVKEADAEYTYAFTGWSPEIVAVTGEATYTAQFSQTKNKYTITFVDADDTELQSSEVEYGETPVYNGEAPTKEADAQYTYTFDGWDSEIAAVTGNKTYKATYSQTKKKYIITFVDADDTELQSSEVEYGETPVYNGEAPTKEADAQYTYTFDGWTPSITPVTKDTTYKALYNPTLRKYTITFKNYDGTVLQTGEVDYGTTPSYTGETPTKPNDGDTEYVFAGWSPEVASVAGAAEYTATFIEKAKSYQVTFETNGGSEIAGFAVEENTKITKPTDPTKSGFVFIAWYTTDALETEYDFNTLVTGPVTLYAKWEEEVAEYKIIEGANQEYEVEEAQDLIIASNGNFVKFIGIKVDGVELSADCYDAAAGSTVVTLKAAYLKTLPKGEHTVTFMYRDGEVSTKFTTNVEESTAPATDNPVTGDGIINYILALILSIVGTIGGTTYIKKKLAKSTN